MAALVALGEVEVTNVEEVAEGRVRALADARSGDVSRALAAAADRSTSAACPLLNIEPWPGAARQREAAAAQGAAADFGAQTPPAMAAGRVIPNFAETPAQRRSRCQMGP